MRTICVLRDNTQFIFMYKVIQHCIHTKFLACECCGVHKTILVLKHYSICDCDLVISVSYKLRIDNNWDDNDTFKKLEKYLIKCHLD